MCNCFTFRILTKCVCLMCMLLTFSFSLCHTLCYILSAAPCLWVSTVITYCILANTGVTYLCLQVKPQMQISVCCFFLLNSFIELFSRKYYSNMICVKCHLGRIMVYYTLYHRNILLRLLRVTVFVHDELTCWHSRHTLQLMGNGKTVRPVVVRYIIIYLSVNLGKLLLCLFWIVNLLIPNIPCAALNISFHVVLKWHIQFCHFVWQTKNQTKSLFPMEILSRDITIPSAFFLSWASIFLQPTRYYFILPEKPPHGLTGSQRNYRPAFGVENIGPGGGRPLCKCLNHYPDMNKIPPE